MRHLSGIFWRHSWDIGTMDQIILNFLYVCQSGNWHTSPMKSDNLRNISSSVWYIFLNFYGHIPGMLVHMFQIILIFLNVCQSGSWLTSLMKSDKFRDISRSGWDIFLNVYGHIPGMLVLMFKIIQIFCMSVSLIVAIPPYWNMKKI